MIIGARDQSTRTHDSWNFEVFKYKREITASPSATLPEPNGSQKKRVPSKAIELANAEGTKLTENRACGRGLYRTLAAENIGELNNDSPKFFPPMPSFSKSPKFYAAKVFHYTVAYTEG